MRLEITNENNIAISIKGDLYTVRNVVFYETKTDLFSKDWRVEIRGYSDPMALQLRQIEFPEILYRPRVKLDGNCFVTGKNTNTSQRTPHGGTTTITKDRYCTLYLSAKIFKFFKSTHVQNLGYVERLFQCHISETFPSIKIVDTAGGFAETEVGEMKKRGLDALAEKLRLKKTIDNLEDRLSFATQDLRDIDPLGRITHEYETKVLPAIEKLTAANGG